MSKRRRTRQRSSTGRFLAVALVLGAVILGGVVVSQSSAPGNSTTLRDTDTTFSISTHIGQPAPEFTAVGVDGQPYTVTPGDGRPKAIVFYMGYG